MPFEIICRPGNASFDSFDICVHFTSIPHAHGNNSTKMKRTQISKESNKGTAYNFRRQKKYRKGCAEKG